MGLSLSTATLNQCLHEAGRAVAPVVQEAIVATLREAELIHADETSWSQRDQHRWLWVFTSATTVFFLIGRRSRAVLVQALGTPFSGWVMCDGYQADRHLPWRLRCWAHILRQAQAFGTQVLATLEALFEPSRAHAEASHAKTGELARELLLDWDTFWGVLDDPTRPLTNNEAERALRHWVIARRISLGTRTEQGSRAFTLLASVIETCHKRAVSPWPYLTKVIRQRRCGLPAPPLPKPAA